MTVYRACCCGQAEKNPRTDHAARVPRLREAPPPGARQRPARPDATLYGISDAAEFRHHVVTELRATLARYPADPAVSGLIDELRDGSRAFARLWNGMTCRRRLPHETNRPAAANS